HTFHLAHGRTFGSVMIATTVRCGKPHVFTVGVYDAKSRLAASRSVAAWEPASGGFATDEPTDKLLEPELVERLGEGLGARQPAEEAGLGHLVDQHQHRQVGVSRALAQLPHDLPGRPMLVVV